ncbi:MAG: putative lipid II flippase FtsW [Alphaproteobacteria bacterium]|nr:MAG: putative lipid II flippase FtsW [Alphaproteobacteria bacterium]
MNVFARTDTSLIGRWWWTVDRWLLFSLAILIAFGLLLTIGASVAVAERLGLNSFHFAERQMAFLVLALGLMFAISLASVRTVRRLAVVMFPVALSLVAAATLFGPEIKGSQRWLPLGGFTLQPSEFLKPAFIVVSAWMFAEQERDPVFPGWRIATALYLMVALLLVSQPDLGQTVLITVVWLAQFFLAGLPLFWVLGLGLAGILGLVAAYSFLPHVASRIDRFLDPTTGDTYQIDTALNAFRAGGMFGRGPGEGLVKRVLPDSHTDFIFAVAGEEFGALACVGLVVLFAVIVVRGLLNLLREDDYFVFLATAGLLIQFGLQAFINIAVNLALLPAKGMTLPFVSYGGSSLLALSISMGMVLALTRRDTRGGRSARRAWRQAW